MNKKLDLHNKKINNFIVLEEVARKKGLVTWKCQCECGEIRFWTVSEIKRNKSCGCSKKKSRKDDPDIDKKFNKLTIKQYSHTDKRRAAWYICLCECGKEKTLPKSKVKKGYVKSCGCLNDPWGDRNKNWTGYKEISGVYWKSVRNAARARGIPFDINIEYAWDLFLEQDRKCALTNQDLIIKARHGHKEANASIDRKDSSKPYTPDNIQWVHKDINLMKRDFEQQYFLDLCKQVYLHSEKES